MILAVCFQLKQLKKRPEKNLGLNGILFKPEDHNFTHFALSDNDECASSPCFNGKCIDGVDSYTCNCNPRYSGLQCEFGESLALLTLAAVLFFISGKFGATM